MKDNSVAIKLFVCCFCCFVYFCWLFVLLRNFFLLLPNTDLEAYTLTNQDYPNNKFFILMKRFHSKCMKTDDSMVSRIIHSDSC